MPFELLFRDVKNSNELSDDNLSYFKTRLKDISISSYHNYNKGNHKLENISQEEYDALLELKNNENIIIQKADKGNLVVILDKITYVDRMRSIVSDKDKFLALNLTHEGAQKHLLAMEKRIKDTLKPLNDKNIIDTKLYEKLLPVGSQPGKLYGCCKIHKDVIDGCPPFRPIISAINTSTYNLAKFLLPILEPITKNSFVITDSFSFVDDIKKQNTKYFMASLDVEGLFTNIPLDETIDICVDKLFPRKNMKIKGFRKKEFKDLLKLATKESLILFDNQYYQQVDGVAMGSPLGPSLANIFLCHHEVNWLKNCPKQFAPEYYRRYVDDIFILFSDQQHVNQFNIYLNSRHANMRFTNEVENDFTLNFLDILLTKNKGDFVTSIYRKPTYSGVYSHFKSYAPLNYKRGLINCLLFRIFHLCSNWSVIHDEIKNLKCFLIQNKYPLDFVEASVRNILGKLIMISKTTESIDVKKGYNIVIPFLGRQTDIVKKRLTRLFSSFYPNAKIKIVLKPGNKLSSIFSYKDRSHHLLQSLLLYLYTCGSCNATYIGKTKRHHKMRMCEHLGISHITGAKRKYTEALATKVRLHLENSKHSGSFEDFKILGYANNDFELLIKESLLITKLKPTLNKQTDNFKIRIILIYLSHYTHFTS